LRSLQGRRKSFSGAAGSGPGGDLRFSQYSSLGRKLAT
jgi:hypothetical protein